MARVVRKSRAKQIIAATRRQAARAITAGVEAGLEEMQMRVPVDEGDLKSTLEKEDDGAGHGSLSAGGSSKISDRIVDYERHVEFGTTHTTAEGTTHIPAQPYFRPGLDKARQAIKKEMRLPKK